MQFNEKDLKAKDGDRFGSGVMGLGSVLMGGATLRALPLLDLTWHFLLALLLIMGSIGVGALGAFLAYRNRRGEYYEGQFHNVHTGEVFSHANAYLGGAYLCLIVASTLFTWIAWWQGASFSAEPIPTTFMLAFLAAAVVCGYIGAKSLGRLTEMLSIRADSQVTRLNTTFGMN